VLDAEDLHKTYGTIVALDGFDLAIAAGEIVGLIGHNGAGKTTFAEVVTGLVRPDRGDVRVDGVSVRRNPRAARARIGYAPQELGLYPTATLRQNLEVFGRLHGLRRRALAAAIDATSRDLMLTDVLDRPVGELSGGQRQRTQAATALLHRPPVLLLDEPTAGADPETRDALLAAVAKRAGDGAAVCYTTHYLPELEQLGATIAVAAHGRVIARGERADLLRGLTGHATVAYADGTKTTLAGADPIEALVDVLVGGPVPSGVDLHQPNLDDLYRHLAGGEQHLPAGGPHVR
jgi:ABC-2 type transport system ATP-binding protein